MRFAHQRGAAGPLMRTCAYRVPRVGAPGQREVLLVVGSCVGNEVVGPVCLLCLRVAGLMRVVRGWRPGVR